MICQRLFFLFHDDEWLFGWFRLTKSCLVRWGLGFPRIAITGDEICNVDYFMMRFQFFRDSIEQVVETIREYSISYHAWLMGDIYIYMLLRLDSWWELPMINIKFQVCFTATIYINQTFIQLAMVFTLW